MSEFHFSYLNVKRCHHSFLYVLELIHSLKRDQRFHHVQSDKTHKNYKLYYASYHLTFICTNKWHDGMC